VPAAGVQLGDVDRDGILDVVLSTYETLAVRLGDGRGGFGPETAVPAPASSEFFGVADVNHDGRLDVVFDGGSEIVTLLATGDTTWSAPIASPSEVPWDTALGATLGDYDNDGNLDVMTLAGTYLPGHGDGTFGPFGGFATGPALVALSFDWNRDGLLDFLVSGALFLNERRAVNRPPVADAGPDLTVPYHRQWGVDWLLTARASTDPDMHRLAFEWFEPATGATYYGQDLELRPRPPGTYTFQVTARDLRGGESTDTVSLTLAPEPEIVLHVGLTGSAVGAWYQTADDSAASGGLFVNPDANAPKVVTPLANPRDYVFVPFIADPGQTYKLWVRLRAGNDHWSNDSVWVQFTGSADESGRPAYRAGTTSALPVNLEECSGCGISGWGWEDDGWGARNRNGVSIRFPEGGRQHLFIQVREDGVAVDQVVLSAVRYRTSRPGAAKNDTVIVPRTQ
jgi:hypothetical protein